MEEQKRSSYQNDEDSFTDERNESRLRRFMVLIGSWVPQRMPDNWQLDLDDLLHDSLMTWNTLVAFLFLMLLVLILLRGKFDAVFWVILVISLIFFGFYIYWFCIRSPSQYYEYNDINSLTYHYQTRVATSSHIGSEPAEILTTDDIMNTTTYQATPAFRGGSFLLGEEGEGAI